MKLEHLFNEELKKREREVAFYQKQYEDALKGHIVLDPETGADRVDFESFDEKSKADYDAATHSYNRACLRSFIFSDYIREKSGLEFDSVPLRTIEEYMKSLSERSYHHLLCDTIDMETKEEFADIMGQHISLEPMKGKTFEEQKEIYFSMITSAMLSNGFTYYEIDELVNNMAVSMGGKSETNTMSM